MDEVLFTGTELVSINKLKSYEKNPRKGNIKAIAESLETNKQYRPIVVQKSTNQILAGNHTWLAAKSLGWKKVAVVFVDVDDEQAKKIVLADNRTNDLAEYDDKILAELLTSLTSVSGTGYNEADMQAILLSSAGSVSDLYEANEQMDERARLSGDHFASIMTDSDDDDDDDEDDLITITVPREETLENAKEELGGVLQLADWISFKPCGQWEFPRLREDMLISELPENLKTWAGSASRDDDHDGYWLYNWAIDSTSGMKDLSKIMVSFYTHDEYFYSFWENTARNIGKLINTKVKYAIMPNYSSEGTHKAMGIMSNYKSWYVARYMQEAGIKVMPDMECRDEPDFQQAWRNCLPKSLPWVAVQLQNIHATSRTGVKATSQEWIDLISRHSLRQIEGVDVENFLIYCPESRWEITREEWKRKDCNLHFMPTRIELLAKSQIKKAAEKEARGF